MVLLVCFPVFLLLAPAKRGLPPNRWKPLHKRGIPVHNLGFSGHIHFQTNLEKTQNKYSIKVQIFWEGHKIWKNSTNFFWS